MTLAKLVNGVTDRAGFATSFNALVDALNAIMPRYKAGKWYHAAQGQIQAGSALSANSLRLLPFILLNTITISDLQARVTTAVASSNFQLAIYGSDADGIPAGAVLANTGNMSGASAAAVQGAISQGNIQLAPGLYWMGVNTDSAIALQTISSSYVLASGLIGSATPANLAGGNTSVSLIYAITATLGTWPNLTATPATETPNVATSAILEFKVVSVP